MLRSRSRISGISSCERRGALQRLTRASALRIGAAAHNQHSALATGVSTSGGGVTRISISSKQYVAWQRK